jgi:hypothetical protein
MRQHAPRGRLDKTYNMDVSMMPCVYLRNWVSHGVLYYALCMRPKRDERTNCLFIVLILFAALMILIYIYFPLIH